MFQYCNNLEELNLSSWDTRNVTNMRYLFNESETSKLKTIKVSDLWTVSKVVDSHEMFYAPKLVGGKGTTFDKNKLDDDYRNANRAHIDRGDAGHGYFTEAYQYNVSFDMNGKAATAPTVQTHYEFHKVDRPADPVADGYKFGGWYTNAECSNGNEWDFTRNRIKNNMTLYAKWTAADNSNPNPQPGDRFTDVNYTKWMGPAVRYVDAHKYMSGTSDTTFAPNDNCTREMMVQILYNIGGAQGGDGTCTFPDAVPGSWYYKALVWGQKEGVASGKADGTFGVKGNVTRQELAQFICNYVKYCGKDTSSGADISSFPDADEVSGWALGSMKWAYGNAVIGGKLKDGVKYLDPLGKASRAEVAQIIMNVMENVMNK